MIGLSALIQLTRWVMVMSPQLARPDFFLRVLNEPMETHARRVETCDPLAAKLHAAFVQLAERVRTKTACTPGEIQQLNHLFDACSALQLRLVPQGEEEDPAPATGGPLARAALRAHIRGDGTARVYLEAIISLLEALERSPLELNRCEECGAWYIPYNRAAVTRFCSTRCRNRHNYRVRRQATPPDDWRSTHG